MTPRLGLLAAMVLGLGCGQSTREDPPADREPQGQEILRLKAARPAGEPPPCTRTQQEIFGVMKQHLGAINGCVEMARATDPSLPNRLDLEFLIQPNGTVDKLVVHDAESSLAECALQAFTAVRFAEGGGACPVTIPLKIGR